VVAGAPRTHLLIARGLVVPDRRYRAVIVVLIQVLFLNLAVALAKIALGYVTGAVSILSDGFHSLTDSLSNVVGLVGVRVARKPPDSDHPYGHRKFETLAAALIAGFLMLVMLEVLRTAIDRLRHPHPPEVTPLAFGVLVATLIVNLIVATYERRKGRELSSEVLVADSAHTKSDVFTSLTVIAALVGTAAGIPLLDPIAAFIVVGFIARAGLQIALSTSQVLADRVVIGEDALQQVVMSVPGVLGAHHIRTRGPADYVFLDLHVWMNPEMRLEDAHAVSHVVKDLLMERYPQIADAVIHIEPPPIGWNPEGLEGRGVPE
jgi:cation diffusion facilitator family transporter